MNRGSAQRRRTRAMLVVCLLAATAGLTAWATGFPQRQELATVDARFSIRGTGKPPDRLAVIAIDDRTFGALQRQWPFPRSLHARLIDRLVASKVKAIGFDVQFTEPTTEAQDGALLDSIGAASDRGVPVVLATEETDGKGGTGVLGGNATLAAVGAKAGNSSFTPDAGGTWRRTERRTGGLDQFPAAIAIATGSKPPRFPADGAYIDFAGPPGTIPTWSMGDVLDGTVGEKQLRGRTVVIGATSPTLQDVHPVPVASDQLMSGAEVSANAVGTIAAGLPLRDVRGPLAVLAILLLALVTPLAGLRLRPVAVIAVGLVAGAAWALTCQLAFNAGVVLPVLQPAIGLLVGLFATLAALLTLEAFERQRVTDLLARFVGADVAEDVIDQSGGDLRATAVRRECTVMFNDLRSFTAFSESRPPEQVAALLNVYLEAMTDRILAHGGAIVAYLGDGIMSVFGAPLEQTDHADRAVGAASEMLAQALDEVNRWAAANGIAEPFRMGIGINTGEVMAGIVGSEQRVEFAAVGDTTNTAARLSSLTKEVDRSLLISGTTKLALTDSSGFEPVGAHDVRGRDAAVELWAPADPVA